MNVIGPCVTGALLAICAFTWFATSIWVSASFLGLGFVSLSVGTANLVRRKHGG